MNSKRYKIIFHEGVFYVCRQNDPLTMAVVEKAKKEDAIKWVIDADRWSDINEEANKKVNDQLKAEGWQ